MDEQALLSLGLWIKRRRKALDLTQEVLAAQVGCSKELIVKIEGDARRPSRQVAALLAQHLQLAEGEHDTFVACARAELAPDRLPPPIRSVPRVAFSPSPHTPTLAPTVLPGGTITFLFTDVAGSTRLWEQYGAQTGAALARHAALLGQVVARAGGIVFKILGDGICAAFADAPAALGAAVAGQRALQAEAWEGTGPLRVRMALHTGVVDLHDGDYAGLALSRVARLLAAGHGGQILLSLATTELVRDQLPPEVALRDLGIHRLKDLSRPDQIFQLVAPDLPVDFPPLQTLDARRTNLPTQPTPLLGRERELTEVTALLAHQDVRLVTLTGVGGTGKTRLALQAAAELVERFVDGTYVVDLAPIEAPDLVAAAIAQALGVVEAGNLPIRERLKAELRIRELLVVLDNFEQVLDAAPLPENRATHDQALVTARGALDPEMFNAAWKTGQALALEEVVREALAGYGQGEAQSLPDRGGESMEGS